MRTALLSTSDATLLSARASGADCVMLVAARMQRVYLDVEGDLEDR
jgi:hypothetical protein